MTVLQCDPSLTRTRCHRTSGVTIARPAASNTADGGTTYFIFFFSLFHTGNTTCACGDERRRVAPGEPTPRRAARLLSVRPRRLALAGRTEKSGVHECGGRQTPTHPRTHYRLPLLLATPPPERGASSWCSSSAGTGAPSSRARPRARNLAQPAGRYGDGQQSAAVENTARPRHMCFTTPREQSARPSPARVPRYPTSTRVTEHQPSASLARSSRPPCRPRGVEEGREKRAYKYSDRLLESTVSTLLVDNTGGGGGSRSARSSRPCPLLSPRPAPRRARAPSPSRAPFRDFRDLDPRPSGVATGPRIAWQVLVPRVKSRRLPR